MRRMRALSRSPALAATSFACVLLAGCYTWRPSELPLVELVAERPGRLKAYDLSGHDHVVLNPKIQGDTLVGEVETLFGSGQRIALEDIAAVQVRHFNVGATIGVIVLVPFALAALIAACSTDGERQEWCGRR